MPHARLTHSTRDTLEFRQGQLDEDASEAVTNATAELGVDRPTLVHTETREVERSIRGRVTAPRRAANDAGTSDWRQSLANYVDRLESHVDEFQGEGYTLTDDQRDTDERGVLEAVEWSLGQGSPYEIEYSATVRVGRGTMDARSVDYRNPSVQSSMTVAATVDGTDLPGLRELRVRRSIGVNVSANYDRGSAENNDVVGEEGVQQVVTFEGTHTGTASARASADATLDGLVATKEPVDMVLRFPGYTLSGFVIGYDSNLEQRFGGNSHQYSLRFAEGIRG